MGKQGGLARREKGKRKKEEREEIGQTEGRLEEIRKRVGRARVGRRECN